MASFSSIILPISLSLIGFAPLSTLAASLPSYNNVGCYGNPGSLRSQGSFRYETTGYCEQVCWKNGSVVMALTKGDECYCGDMVPNPSYKTDDGDCDVGCAGYPNETCGGKSAWSVFTTTKSGNTNTINAVSRRGLNTASSLPAILSVPSIDPAEFTRIPIIVDSVDTVPTGCEGATAPASSLSIGSSTKTVDPLDTFVIASVTSTAKYAVYHIDISSSSSSSYYSSPTIATMITTAPDGPVPGSDWRSSPLIFQPRTTASATPTGKSNAGHTTIESARAGSIIAMVLAVLAALL